jgi:hypothetical protein
MISLERSEKRNHKQRERRSTQSEYAHGKRTQNGYTRQVFLLDTLNLTFKG